MFLQKPIFIGITTFFLRQTHLVQLNMVSIQWMIIIIVEKWLQMITRTGYGLARHLLNIPNPVSFARVLAD